jgi:hypothetical protein
MRRLARRLAGLPKGRRASEVYKPDLILGQQRRYEGRG